MSEAEKLVQIAAIEGDPDYIQLRADLAAVELEIAALNSSSEDLDQDIQQSEQTLKELLARLEALENLDTTKIVDEISSGAISLMDGITQMMSGSVQLQMALTQIDEGLATLEASRESALQQADMGAALNISTITALLTAQNFSMPAGYVEQDGVSYMVSVGDTIDTQQSLQEMVLFDLGLEGIDPICLGDVATSRAFPSNWMMRRQPCSYNRRKWPCTQPPSRGRPPPSRNKRAPLKPRRNTSI